MVSDALPLSRYYALGNGPCPEVVMIPPKYPKLKIFSLQVFSEIQDGKNHYERVADFYKKHASADGTFLEISENFFAILRGWL